MTHKQFEETFAARKATYQAQMTDLAKQMRALKEAYHAGNCELENLRRETIQSDPKKVRKHECYALQHYLGGVLNEWTKTKQLDAVNSQVHFDCCADDKAVFTITIPIKGKEDEV